jgi:DNA-binding PadR family transcriptional regulator
MRTKEKKSKKPEVPLVDVLSAQADPMAMRGILNFLLVCKHAGLKHIADDVPDEALPSMPQLAQVQDTNIKTYSLDADYKLIMMLSEKLLLPMFVEGHTKPSNIRKVDDSCYANPYFPAEGSAKQIFENALAALEKHGCVKRIGTPSEKEKGETEKFQITQKGIAVLAALVKKPDTIRDLEQEQREANKHAVAKALQEGNQGRADRLAAAQLALDEAAKEAQQVAEAAKQAKAERIQAEVARRNQQAVVKPVVRQPNPPVDKEASVANRAEELRAGNIKAEHGVLKFLQWKNATGEDAAIYSGDIKLAVAAQADQAGWTGNRGNNPYQSSFAVLDAVVENMAQGDTPLIATDRNSLAGHSVYYHLTEAGIARLQELDREAKAQGFSGAGR